MSSSPWEAVLLNRDIGRYRPTDFIREGGFGLVFEAKDIKTGEAVALKLLKPGVAGPAVAEFENEGRILQRLRNASGVVDHFETATATIDVLIAGTGSSTVPLPVHYHAMELASGCLEEIVVDGARLARLDWSERLRLWRGLVLGVHQMHLKGLAHRDLKSGNALLMVRRREADTTCKLADFGRSRDLSKPASVPPDHYLPGRGDFRFAPPEFLWWQGEDSPASHKRADLYGLGSLLYELATGIGITQAALGYGPDIVKDAQAKFLAGQTLDLSALRPRYEPVLDLFGDEIPAVIRTESTALLRQLCDPQPNLRLPRSGPGRRTPASEGLEWLLRRTDILIKRLNTASTPRRTRYGKVAS